MIPYFQIQKTQERILGFRIKSLSLVLFNSSKDSASPRLCLVLLILMTSLRSILSSGELDQQPNGSFFG